MSEDFNDNNDAEVEVTLECNTGLPLQQTTTISEGDPVNFVITDFEPGTGASCTMFNTRLFAGIPTLSQYGLAVLALLMLGVGLVAFRRFA